MIRLFAVGRMIGLTCSLLLMTTAVSMAQSSGDIAHLLPAALQSCSGALSPGDVEVERRSLYVPASDGVRLAVDVFLPKKLAAGAKLPTLYAATRYWRGEMGAPATDDQKRWVARGFAVVSADVRGTGASFGQWYIPYSPLETRDIGYLANWIATQPWSNGKVVMTGTSYPGTTPLMALAFGQPAIKAVAPKFADFDLYADLLMPGGVSSEALTVKWGELVRQMDLNKAPDGSSASVRPVDGPDGDTQLASAVEDHKINPWSFDRAAYEVTYKDEPLTQFGGMPIDDAGVFLLQHAAEQSRAPIFGWGSWLDSGIAQGLLNRFMNWTNPQLSIIGPWTHGARNDVNVFHPNEPLDPSRHAQEQMIYCFLSNYVSDRPEPLASHTLYYFTMGEDRWKTTHVWPLPGTRTERLYLAADNTLTTTHPTVAGRDVYKVDFDASAGPSNRWATQAGEPTIDYGDRAEADRRLLVYTGAPLAQDLELTGQPVITLRVTSTHTDGHFFVYLEDVAPNGRVTYLTEGELRALDRRLSQATPRYKTTYPYRTYSRSDAEPLVPGQPATLTFQLMATSVLVRANHRLRIAIAGADKGTFLRVPAMAQGDVTISVLRGGPDGSFMELPVIPRVAGR
jgi:putative CocE/NonD family hydrolase